MSLDELEASFREGLIAWGAEHYREFPWRKTEDSYRVLLAEILLQRTLAQKVVPVFEEIISDYPDWDALSRAEPSNLASILEPLGLQNRKSDALINISTIINNQGFPHEYDELVELPFVGRYAANATLCYAFGESRPVVDVNVIRIYNRVFGHNFENDQDHDAWEFAARLVPRENPARYNSALLDFGAKICTARSPECQSCPHQSNCHYYMNLV